MSTIESSIAATVRERVFTAVANALGEAYYCVRTWSAWGEGTMSEDDFELVSEDNGRVSEIADAAIAAMAEPAEVVEPVKNAFGMTLPLSTPEDEKQALRDMLEDARAELEALRIALGVPEEPHQSIHERMLERAREIGILQAYRRDYEKVIRERDYAAGSWGLRELKGLSGENTVSHLVYLLLNERHSPRKRKLSMRGRKRPRGRIRHSM
ncbi:hypothetical protein AB4Y45_34730 [Paraburkholderia sp. EG287A]|uniref:hypothetical protein n=1 Tax=Paraburkholderia sp. EG287A TaxID=3237012 RepID=UPI0034D2AE52